MSLSEQALQGTFSATALLELLVKLGCVVALVYLSAWGWRRWGGQTPRWGGTLTPAPPLKVVQVQRLTAQHAVHVLECEGKRLLVATGPQGTDLLIQWPQEEPHV